ncbi:MAG: thioredoxin domain-containing protein [Acidobacteriota bacterium]|nr:thioredoxin domain-containing protein [Blastocatellia bacterium]MDW8413147.1 thioredoxin domain-containing protein [Acidobacteriota bacterium]
MKKSNRLINETSPYLLQHAYNPVDWYPWCNEALQKAKAEDKPILLSIGYSACHWCHVMERESFENEQIADLMNKLFICIKVDREERPDLDQIYMNAVQMMTGSGGWPLTVFLTPDGVPFYGGTYFPPVDKYNMPSFPRVLKSVAEAYKTRKHEIQSTAKEILEELNKVTSFAPSYELLTEHILRKAYHNLAQKYDDRYGGFGQAPKFPQPMNLNFLLQRYHKTKDPECLEMVEHTLDCMARGGIYDHLGGGFARYSTDAKWLVPHFEKMLYDNALLAPLYLRAYLVTKRERFRKACVETLEWVLREMTDASGGFYSTLDADSEGIEGKFYLWDKQEIDSLLGDQAAAFACYYGVTTEGNFEGKNILHIPRPIDEMLNLCAKKHKTADFAALLESCRSKLLEARAKRIPPGRDDKILTSWNGLMISALAEAGAVLDRPDFIQAAVKATEFIFSNCFKGDRLMHSYKNNTAKFDAYVEDYAYLSNALISLYEATLDVSWIDRAIQLADKMIELFWDAEHGGFFFTAHDHEELIARLKDYTDDATPSGNSIAATALLKLHALTGEQKYEEKAVQVLRCAAQAMQRFPAGFGQMLCALDIYLNRPTEIVIVGPRSRKDTQELLRAAYSSADLKKVIAFVSPQEQSRPWPLLEGRRMIDDKATAYVCKDLACQKPATDAEELVQQLTNS